MRQLLAFLVENIVDQKDAVGISETMENGAKILHLKVAPDDMGKIIGKDGKVIKALRGALKVRSFVKSEKFHLVLEDQNPPYAEN